MTEGSAMTTAGKLRARLSYLEGSQPTFQAMADGGNRYALGYAQQMRDDIRWLKWVLARMEDDG